MSDMQQTRGRSLSFGFSMLVGVIALVATGPIPLRAAEDAGASDFAAIEVEAGRITAEAERGGALGGYWDANAGELVIVVPKSGFSADAVVASRTVSTRVQETSIVSDQVERAKDGVIALVELGALKGETTEVSLNLQIGRIEIRSTAPETMFVRLLDALGSNAVFLVGKGPFDRLSRLNDASPYKGGAKLLGQGFTCSSGFAVKLNSNVRMLTAGHCFSLGATITDGGGDAFGTVTARALYPSRDTELIGGQTYTNRIFTGAGDVTTNPVNQASDPVVGIDYCSNGYVGHEVCALHATAVHLLACDPGGLCTDKMVRFSNDNPFFDGDSGGPIFIYSGPNVQARGTIIGEWSGNSYGQEWSSIAAAHNVVICSTNPC